VVYGQRSTDAGMEDGHRHPVVDDTVDHLPANFAGERTDTPCAVGLPESVDDLG
jgi:hypothetical protein